MKPSEPRTLEFVGSRLKPWLWGRCPKIEFFPTCQMRVVRFYSSASPPCQTLIASSRSQWALPDLNRQKECEHIYQIDCQNKCEI